MDIELIEIRDFLYAHPPFNRLSHDTLARLPRHITIRYLRRGTPFPPPDLTVPVMFLVRQGVIELRDPDGQLLELLSEGDLFSDLCPDAALSIAVKAHTREDTLLYQIPCTVTDELRNANPLFERHFSRSLSERLRHALLSQQEHASNGLLTVHCGDLVSRTPVVVPPDTTIHDAAQLMTEQNISALLVSLEERVEGIVTDRDLRKRCLATGLATTSPISAIMTTPLHKVAAESSAYEALLTMTRLGVHHIPVIRHGQTIGMITATDLFRHQSSNAVHLVSSIRRSTSLDAVIGEAKRLPELQRQLMAAGASGRDLGKTITAVVDTITIKLLELAEQQFGAPPVPYTWLVFGSQARQEQSSVTDQDNGLLLDDAFTAEHAPYFTSLANYVSSALDQCGIRFCNGDVMASNPQWCQPLARWKRYFTKWVEQPEPMAMMHVSIFFDMRALHGAVQLADQLRAHMLRQTRGNSLFLAHLTANALHHRPPLGFFRQLVLIKDGEHDEMLDLKLHGIIPVVDLARVHALAAGLPELHTYERLKAAKEENVLSGEAIDNLLDVMDLLMTLRARHQAEQIRNGAEPDNFISPHQLSALERRHLKDAFSVIATVQRALAQRYQSERFG